MAKDTKRLLEIEARKFEPILRDAFLQAIVDIKLSANVTAIVEALERGDVEAVIGLLKLDNSYYGALDEAIRATYTGGATYQIATLPKRNPATGISFVFRFQGQQERAQRWVMQKSSTRITQINDGQRELVREVIREGLSMGRGPKVIARDLVGTVDKVSRRRTGGVIGLSDLEKGWVKNYRLKLEGEDRPADQIERMVLRYQNKALRYRGERIARTETIAALNAGRDEAMRQLIESGEVAQDAVTGTWDSSGDGKVRDTHASLDGQVRAIDEPFQSSSGALLMHPGDTSLGAGADEVINCRCYKALNVDFLKGL